MRATLERGSLARRSESSTDSSHGFVKLPGYIGTKGNRLAGGLVTVVEAVEVDDLDIGPLRDAREQRRVKFGAEKEELCVAGALS